MLKKDVKSDIEKQREHFDRVAQQYVSAHQDPKCVYVMDAIFGELFAAAHFSETDIAVLDAMCGSAFGYALFAKYLKTPFIYEGFDYSENMVVFAKQKYPDLHIYQQDITTFSPQKQYDIAIIIGGLHHVYAQRHVAARNIADALKPGGLFLNFEPTHNNKLFDAVRSYIYRNNPQFDADTECDFSTEELNELMTENGFSVDTQFFPGLLAYVLWGNPDVFPWLNRGNLWIAKKLVKIEKIFWRTRLARFLSFVTVSAYLKTR